LIPLHDDNPTRSTPVVTLLLIAANVIVFLLQLAAGDRLTYAFAMVPVEILAPERGSPFTPINLEPAWFTLITSMFLHGGWMHLLGNMLYLWIFGNNLEDTLGKLRFLIFYLLCGGVAGVLHLITNPFSVVPTVGASGAIAGVLGGYIVLFPHARIATLVPIFFFWSIYQIPAQVVLGFWFLLQLVNAVYGSGMLLARGGEAGGGVAFWAHVGGFVAGFVLVRLFGARRPEPPRRRPSFMDY
jgi:membrane associated rhomboid family serine protease